MLEIFIGAAAACGLAFTAYQVGWSAGERVSHGRLRDTEQAVTELLIARRCLMEELTRTRGERDEARRAGGASE
jgi:hypothetical protein